MEEYTIFSLVKNSINDAVLVFQDMNLEQGEEEKNFTSNDLKYRLHLTANHSYANCSLIAYSHKSIFSSHIFSFISKSYPFPKVKHT